jgi:hypothetical protein
MSSLWTPSGEHPVDRSGAGDRGRPAPPTDDAGAPQPGAPGPPPGVDGPDRELTPEERAAAEEYALQVEAAREQLLAAPAGLVVGQQALQFYELAALHLSQPEPRLDDARIAIDALAAVVESLGSRLGEAEPALRQALNQLQLAFVEVSRGGTGDAGNPAT